MGWGDPGNELSTSAKAGLSPGRGNMRYQGLLVSLERRWVLGGLRRRKEELVTVFQALPSADVLEPVGGGEGPARGEGRASVCLILCLSHTHRHPNSINIHPSQQQEKERLRERERKEKAELLDTRV